MSQVSYLITGYGEILRRFSGASKDYRGTLENNPQIHISNMLYQVSDITHRVSYCITLLKRTNPSTYREARPTIKRLLGSRVKNVARRQFMVDSYGTVTRPRMGLALGLRNVQLYLEWASRLYTQAPLRGRGLYVSASRSFRLLRPDLVSFVSLYEDALLHPRLAIRCRDVFQVELTRIGLGDVWGPLESAWECRMLEKYGCFFSEASRALEGCVSGACAVVVGEVGDFSSNVDALVEAGFLGGAVSGQILGFRAALVKGAYNDLDVGRVCDLVDLCYDLLLSFVRFFVSGVSDHLVREMYARELVGD